MSFADSTETQGDVDRRRRHGARDELGTQFDPAVVAALLEVLELPPAPSLPASSGAANAAPAADQDNPSRPFSVALRQH